MKKKKIAVISVASILTVAGVGSLLLSNKLGKSSSKEENILKNNQTLAMYIEGDDGYELSTSKTFPTTGYRLNTEKSTCKNGGTITQDPKTKALSVSVSHADQCSVYFDKFKPPLEMAIELSQGQRSNFDDPATTDEGIFEMEDDYGTSYYYRGAATNNYVKFGKWNENTPAVYRGYQSETGGSFREYSTLEKCQSGSYNINCEKYDKADKDMYWRIIRINGDGSLRIMYTGTQAYANGADNSDMFIGTSAWSSKTNDAKYVGWMYGGAKGEASTSKEQAQTNETNSDIKTIVDTWYKENIVDTGYSSAVADTLFCNDRTTPGKSVSGVQADTGLGYGRNITCYGAYGRFVIKSGAAESGRSNISPTFKCPEKNDAFTVSDTTKGNSDLTYPVGLITTDEIVAAGSGKAFGSNNQYYLYRPTGSYWSLSPIDYNGSYSYIFRVYTGKIELGMSDLTCSIAPVINISKGYAEKMIGDGTMESPYRIDTGTEDVENPDVLA